MKKNGAIENKFVLPEKLRIFVENVFVHTELLITENNRNPKI